MEDLALIVKRLEVVTEKLEAVGEAGGAGTGAAASQAEKLTISVTAFDDICGGVFKAFLGEMTNQQCDDLTLIAFPSSRELCQGGWRGPDCGLHPGQGILRPAPVPAGRLQVPAARPRRAGRAAQAHRGLH